MKDKLNAVKTKKAIVAFMIIAIFIGLLSTLIVKTVNNKAYELTPEDKRAMNYTLVTEDNAKVDGTENVLFNAYFLRDLDHDGYAEKYNGTCRSMSENAMLYMDVNVLAEGTLTNGKIQVNGQNFDFSMSMIADEVLKYNYLSSNVRTIELKDVNAGTQKLIFGKINPKIYNNINNYCVEENSITFTGTYIPLEGEPIEIEKTIDLTVDWYGTTSATMVKNTKYEVLCDDIEDNTIQFNYEIAETANQLILKENSNKVKIPELCGYAPVEVKCLTDGVESNYNEAEKELTIFRESVVNENGIVNQSLARRNTYRISVKYPEEAYKAIVSFETLKFDIEGYYTGYNNPNEEFTNPYKSNVVKDNVQFIIRKEPQGEIFNFYVDYIDKKYISNPYCKYVISNQDIINAYNNFNDEIPAKKKFVVRWQAVRGSQGEVPSMIMSETKENDNYGDKWDSSLIEDYIENTGIYFIGADEILGEDGLITIYDNDTNEIIKEFTKEEWNNYTSLNPYTYDEPINHIRVETSKTNLNSKLEVYNIKELDTEAIINNYTLEELKEVGATYTYLTGICNIESVGSVDKNTADIAYFIHEKSRVSISLEKRNAVVYEKLNNEKIYIDTIKYLNDDAKWKNGEFLVEVPAEILNMEINSISCNNAGVAIEAYELYQDENGKYFIRIITKNEEAINYKITIDCNLIPDPRVATVNREFRLFAHNEYSNEYLVDIEDVYDVNLNNNKTEKVGYSSTNLFIAAPTSLITMETITDYDENTDSEITIAPNVALVNREERQAKININLTNNYTNAISDLRILGKIPYENNKYILTDKDLKSEFTTQITENGINIPNDLPKNIKNSTTIYYSENQNPTKDIENAENGWKTKENVEDWSKIVSYIICINDCKIAKGQSLKFNYDVTLPENVSLNKASYSTHAVYFDLNTEDGKLRLYTEPTKVGLRIVKKYELELTKYKIHSDLTIPGVTYLLKYNLKNYEDQIEEKQKIITTDENGKIEINGLFGGVEYTLKEIKVPDECELNDEEIKFVIGNDDNCIVTGNNKNNSYSNNILKLELEDEIKVKIKINKTKKDSDVKVSGVVFEIVGEDGNSITGKTKDGLLELSGIKLGKLYTLTEKNVPSAVEKNLGVFKFKIIRQESGDISVEVIENSLLKNEYTFEEKEDEICPILNLNIENEIRYSLNITKKDNEGNLINNIYFSLENENHTLSATMKTDDLGKCSINRLSLGETYILKEVKAFGYFCDKDNDYISFRIERDGNLKITRFDKNGNIKVVGEPTITEDDLNANFNITLENEKIPTYNLKIIKKNEFGELLSGARFELKNLSNGKKQEVVVNPNGEAEFYGLYENIVERGVSAEYELTEKYAPEGYRLDGTVLKFSAKRDENGILQFNGINGMIMIKDNVIGDGKDIETDEEKVTLCIVNKPIFSLIKYGEGENLLPNAKFEITDLRGNPAKDSLGNIIGELENGKYLLTTDENGKLTANLVHGIYKAVEIEAPEEYELSENINERTFYFGIGESRDAIYSNEIDTIAWEKENISGTLIPGNDEGILVISTDSITHFNKDGDVIWQKEKNFSTIYKADSCMGNGYELVVGISGENESIEYDGHIINVIPNKMNYVKIKIDNNGEFQESNSFAIETTGQFLDVNELGNIILNNDGNIKEYSMNGELISECTIKLLPYANGYGVPRPIEGVISTKDGYLSYGYVANNIEFEIKEGVIISGGNNVIIKYNKDGEYQRHYTLYYSEGTIQGITYFPDSDNCIIQVNNQGRDLENDVRTLTLNLYEINKDGQFRRIYQDSNPSWMLDLWHDRNYYPIIKKMKDKFGYYEYMYTVNKIVSGSSNNEIRFGSFSTYSSFNEYASDLIQDKDGYIYAISNSLRQYTYGIAEAEIPDLQEIEVHNKFKNLKITTQIGKDLSGYSGGGTITGEYNDEYPSNNNIKFVESVKYGNDSEKEIIIKPNEGYYIGSIVINGIEEHFESDDNGKVIIPSGYFGSMKEDQHIIVTFERKRILIKKTNELGEPLQGAKFEIEKNRKFLDIPEVIPNGDREIFDDLATDQSQLLGDIVNKDENYYFEKNDNGGYKTNNVESGSGYVKSYIPIDLSNYDGVYKLSFNYFANKTSAYGGNVKFVVSENEEYNTLVDIVNNMNIRINNEYLYQQYLDGGKKYYIHIEPYISNISDLELKNLQLLNCDYRVKYYMEESDGVYSSNNIAQNQSTAESYSIIDLTNETEPYYLKFDYECKATSYDCGYIYVTEDKKMINRSSNSGKVLKCSSNQSGSATYSLQAGKKYYIHMGYYNGQNENSIGDYFTVNSITLSSDASYPVKYTSDLTNENGEVYVYVNKGGTYTIKETKAPNNYKISEERKEIVLDENSECGRVTFINYPDRYLYIKKTDEESNPIGGAKFEIKRKCSSITEFGEPVRQKYISNGEIVSDESQLVGELISASTYYFEKQEDGKYKNNNQVSETSRAISQIPIDLTGHVGMYRLVVNATMNAGYNDYARIGEYAGDPYTEDISVLNSKRYNSNNTDINCELDIAGNQKYNYINISFYDYKDNNNAENNEFIVNSIKLYKLKSEPLGLMEKEGGYESNNVGMNNTTATTYIPLDLTNYQGKYELKINARVEGTVNDYGYVYVTNYTSTPYVSNSASTQKMIYINGVTDNKDYNYVLDGGKVYYIHMGYINGNTDTDLADKFIINSMKVSSYEYLYTVTSNSDGDAMVALDETGIYVVKEIEAPYGYVLDDKEYQVEIDETGESDILSIINYKAQKVIVHHYLEGTGEEYSNEPVVLAEEDTVLGKLGTPYTTSPNMEIPKYTLVKKENGEYNIPENATGTFTEEEQHVYYYYNTKPINLVVHHYLEGTEDKLAEDELSTYDVGDHYKTNPSEDVLEEYELVQVVGDAEKDIVEDEEVTYYYVKKQHEITTRVETISYLGKSEKGGEITGEGEEPYETVKHGNSNTKEIIMIPNDGFKIEKVLINKLTNGEIISTEEVEDAKNLATNFELPQIDNIVNDYEIVVQYAPDMGKVIVHHYIEGTKIKIAPNEITIDDYGKVVKTNPVDPSKNDLVENSEKYILVESPENEEITIERQDKEVTYYYQAKYEITTEVVPYNRRKEDGTTEKIKGGTITGEEENPYEEVMKGNDSTKEIKIVPDEEYKIKFVRINGEKYDFKEKLAEDGSLTLDNFTNIDEDKHIEVEFRPILNPDLEIVVKHIEVNEKEIKAGLKIDSGKLLKQESFMGTEGSKIDLNREEFKDKITNRNYISVDGPDKKVMGDIIVVDKKDNKKNVEFVDVDKDEDDESDIIEVRFYYEKQYAITTEVKEHEELDKNVKGGKISGEELDEYEIVGNKGNNEKEVIVEPDKGYRVKNILVNGTEFDYSKYESYDHKVSIPKGYFKEISHDKHIIVEFEKIPAKVIIKHLEEGTDKELKEKEIKDGFVGENYSSERAEIDGYEPAGDDPSNAKGEMTEKDITIIYYYKKIEVIEEPEEPKEEPQQEEPEEPKEEEPQQEEPEEPKEEEPQQEEPEEPKEEETQQEKKEEPKVVEAKKEEQKEETKIEEVNEEKIYRNSKNVKTGDNIISKIICLITSVGVIIKVLLKKNNDK